ncbi:MAG TPA: hypothetical protein VK208_15130, partial [Pyrinomonadaceae bacterium]|nr:hypothetical protein [Pyrinomonadaceae bacterium]
MSWHLYVVPIILVTRMGEEGREPKYIGDMGVSWAMIDYGMQPTCILAADVDATQDQSIAGRPDAIPVPVNLDSTVGGNPVLNALKSKLAANMTPETWIVAATTYRQVLRMINAISILLLRYAVMTSDVLPPLAGFTLDSLFSALPLAKRNGLIAAAQNLGLSTNAFILTNTLRVVLQSVGDRMTTVGRKLG